MYVFGCCLSVLVCLVLSLYSVAIFCFLIHGCLLFRHRFTSFASSFDPTFVSIHVQISSFFLLTLFFFLLTGPPSAPAVVRHGKRLRQFDRLRGGESEYCCGRCSDLLVWFL